MLNSKLGQTIQSSFVDCSSLSTVDLEATGTITMHNLTVTGTFVGPAPEPSPDLACDTLLVEDSLTTNTLTATGTTTVEDLVINGTYTGPPAPVPSDIECDTLTAGVAIASPEAAFSGTVEVGTLNAETSTIGDLTVSGTLTATVPTPSAVSCETVVASTSIRTPKTFTSQLVQSGIYISGDASAMNLTAAQVANNSIFLDVTSSGDRTITLPSASSILALVDSARMPCVCGRIEIANRVENPAYTTQFACLGATISGRSILQASETGFLTLFAADASTLAINVYQGGKTPWSGTITFGTGATSLLVTMGTAAGTVGSNPIIQVTVAASDNSFTLLPLAYIVHDSWGNRDQFTAYFPGAQPGPGKLLWTLVDPGN